MNAQMLLQSFAGGEEEKTCIEEVFSTYLYTGSGATQTINNGIDLAGKGGMTWIKDRTSGTKGHAFFDTERGANSWLDSSTTLGANTAATNFLTSFNSNGFSLTSSGNVTDRVNTLNNNLASWTFRTAPKFFKCVSVTKSAGSNATVDLSSLGTVGMVTVKRADSTGDWYTWHRSLSAGQLMYLNQTAATAALGHITVSGTTLTLVNGVIADGSYVVYAWAHDPSATGIIQCGSYTGNNSVNNITLGWEPQFVIIKSTFFADANYTHWIMADVMRGMEDNTNLNGSYARTLDANNSSAETTGYSSLTPIATGFKMNNGSSSENMSGYKYIYLAIRRPNKPPTSGTEVFAPVIYTGSGVAPGPLATSDFPVDLTLATSRSNIDMRWFDRLRGQVPNLGSSTTSVENTSESPNGVRFNSMVGVRMDVPNSPGVANLALMFRRAPGFMDVVCDTGTGAAHAINHNLTVAPELIIRKSRSASTQWEWWHSSLSATEKLVLNSNAAKTTDATAFGTLPTATQFFVGASANTNAASATYVTYLFATCPGVSKVFGYIGNGSSQTINCGFSGGARFVLIKASSATGSWWIYDTARGIVSSADPALQLNSPAAEISTADAIDPDPSGFIVNQEASCSINANGVSYVGLAIS